MVFNSLLATVLSLTLAAAVRVENLHGAPPVNFLHHAGYFEVAEKRHIHYWFIESQNNPLSDPTILWLTGGPGCSGFSAAFTEVGPFTIDESGETLSFNAHAWNKNANLLVIESPVGTGFSYSESNNFTTDDETTARETFQLLKAFFEEYSEFKESGFYVIGESYAGIYVPTLVDVILNNEENYKINLKGMAIGNGCVSEKLETDTLIPLAYHHGLIDETTWSEMKERCCEDNLDNCSFHDMLKYSFCENFVRDTTMRQWYSHINPYGIYADCKENSGPKLQTRVFVDRFQKLSRFFDPQNLPRASATLPCIDEYPLTNYMNLKQVREAFSVPTHLEPWSYCNKEVLFNYKRNYKDMQSRVQDALKKGIKVWLYYGDTDMACNFLMGQKFAYQLGYKVTTMKQLYKVGDQVAGFYTQYENVTFVTIRGAGHMVPTDKPEVAFHLLQAFLHDTELGAPEASL